MKKIVIPFLCLAFAVTYMTGCSSKKNSSSVQNNSTPQSATATSTLPANINPDKELARVSTLKNFFKSRSITLNEKVLRFSFDDAQMKYAGFEISSDTDALSDIAVDDTVDSIEYKSKTGLTAYVAAVNKRNVAVDYTKCKYYSLRLIKGECKDVVLHLPDKIGWDSNAEKIKKIYGTPTSEETNDSGNTVLTYYAEDKQINESYSMELVTDENGIIELTITFNTI